MARTCRDCGKCTERGVTRLIKKAANATLVVGTLGTSAVTAKAIKGMRKTCRECGHPLEWHQEIDGRFKD